MFELLLRPFESGGLFFGISDTVEARKIRPDIREVASSGLLRKLREFVKDYRFPQAAVKGYPQRIVADALLEQELCHLISSSKCPLELYTKDAPASSSSFSRGMTLHMSAWQLPP